MNPLYPLLIFVPAGLISSQVGGPPLLTFAASALGVVPPAGLIGEATEELAARTGPRVGGLLNATLGKPAEHLVAVQMAARDRMQLSPEISLGSSLQIALFVAPILVFVSLLVGHPMDPVFNEFELIALTAAALIAALVALDGESNRMEGAQ